jgi:hypothetical protein
MEFNKPKIVTLALWGVILMGSILAFAYIFYIIYWAFTYPETPKLIAEHLAAVLGLPICAIGSFILVYLLKVGESPIEIEGLSFKFSGAAGPVVLWIFCFLAMVSGIKMLF